MHCLLCAREISSKEETVACGNCKKTFHGKCLDITEADLKLLRENNSILRCPTCTQAGRKLRSVSTSSSVTLVSAPSASSASILPDHVNTILEELRSIKDTQVKIVCDIAKINESQANLADDIHARCNQLQDAVKECKLTLESHTDALTAHEINISDISEKVTNIEEKIARITQDFCGASSTLDSSNRSMLDAAIGELNDRERRKFNIMIFKLPESEEVDPLQRKVHDTGVLTELFASICPEVDCRGLKVHRMGNRSTDKVRPVRVVLRSEVEVRKILASAQKAKDIPKFKLLIISSDKTPRQQSQYQDLKRQLSERFKNGEKNLKIRYVSGVPKIVNLN